MIILIGKENCENNWLKLITAVGIMTSIDSAGIIYLIQTINSARQKSATVLISAYRNIGICIHKAKSKLFRLRTLEFKPYVRVSSASFNQEITHNELV